MGIFSDACSEDLKKLCEAVGEVEEVTIANFLWVCFGICFLLQFRVGSMHCSCPYALAAA
uniref:Uncharacterized protein n=1 Tax=Arundo donax TaxID=35708 RepID=A0A0A8Z0V8_ARUDO